jgi:hypothetical protein
MVFMNSLSSVGVIVLPAAAGWAAARVPLADAWAGLAAVPWVVTGLAGGVAGGEAAGADGVEAAPALPPGGSAMAPAVWPAGEDADGDAAGAAGAAGVAVASALGAAETSVVAPGGAVVALIASMSKEALFSGGVPPSKGVAALAEAASALAGGTGVPLCPAASSREREAEVGPAASAVRLRSPVAEGGNTRASIMDRGLIVAAGAD